MMRGYGIYLAMLLATLAYTTLALPLASSAVSSKEISLVKRMDNRSNELTHDPSCQCFDCYARKIEVTPYQDPMKVIEDAACPVGKLLLQAPLKAAEWALQDCERKRIEARTEEIRKDHRLWLQMMGVDPNTVKVIPRGQGSSSSTSFMAAPNPMEPMSHYIAIDSQDQLPPRQRASSGRGSKRNPC